MISGIVYYDVSVSRRARRPPYAIIVIGSPFLLHNNPRNSVPDEIPESFLGPVDSANLTQDTIAYCLLGP